MPRMSVIAGMKPSRWATVATALAVGGAAAGTLATTLDASAASSQVVVKTRHISPYGTVLTTSNGHTLYVYSHDRTGKSNCNGVCASEWPPLTVPKGGSVSGVAGLGTIKRSDGRRQVAFHGHALYRFAGDGAGQVKGQGVEHDWYVETTSGVSHASPSTPKPTPTQSSPPSGGGYGY